MAKNLLPLVFGTALVSFNLHAADFSKADNLFAQRGDGLSEAVAAKEAYRDLLPSLSSDKDKIYAVSQMSRIDIYVGGMLPGVDQSKRNEMLDDCIENSNQIAATKSQEYYYYYLACMAIRGKKANMLERIKFGFKMKSVQGDALDSTRNAQGQLEGGYEGGGILRVISAVRSNTMARPLGLYNIQESVDYARLALNTAKHNIPPYGELSGRDYFENYFYLANAEVGLGVENNDKAAVVQGQKTAESALEKIADLRDLGDLPPGREPEINHYERELKGLSSNIATCLADSDWKSCLVNVL